MNHNDERRHRDLGYAGEIARRVVIELGVHRRHHCLRGLRTDEQRIAVRRRLGDVFGADNAAGADAVVNDERHADTFGEFLREDARGEVNATACSEWHNDSYRLVRERLGGPNVRRGKRARRAGEW